MRRLVITGLPCPTQTWERFLGKHAEQRILSIREVLEHSDSSDPRILSRYVTGEIEKFQPHSIVCHDMGVPLTLLSLLRLKKRRIAMRSCITLFNGAFRRFDIFKANHPFRIQLMSNRKAIAEVQAHGGEIDLELRPLLPKIRAMYRYIILFGLTEKVSSLVGVEDLIVPAGKIATGIPIQLIASANDPYIPLSSIRQLAKDFPMQRVVEMDYGHFPYTLPSERVVPLIEEFERANVAEARPSVRAKRPHPRAKRPPEASGILA